MKYPFFASFIVLCLLLMYEIHKRREKEAKKYQEFWDEENKANSTRKKSLDNLNYITIPFNQLPMDIMTENEQVKEYLELLSTLSENPIVNFTGLSNTELKLEYGAANIDLLSAYDQSYTLLARTLNDWAKFLYNNNYIDEAKTILEYALSTRTDVSESYMLLATIYKETCQLEKIKELIPVASEINSLMSKSIVNRLNNLLMDSEEPKDE